jgi:hypothetical protein
MNSLLVLVLSMARADAGPFDHSHAAFGAFLSGAVSDTGVDYGLLATRRAKLDEYLASVEAADMTGWNNAQKLALYVNAYNAYTLALMLDNGPPASITNLDGGKVWDTRKFAVAGQELTLNQMENAQARKLGDARVHGVLNCASKGCPALAPAPLTEAGQSAQLDEGARRWARTNAFKIEGDTVKLSMIFDWYGEDFTKYNQGDLAGVEGEPENALWFLSKYVDEATKQRLLSGSLAAGWSNYDWSLNKK